MRFSLLFSVSLTAYSVWISLLTNPACAQASRYDVVINEIFADPSPAIGLPPDEFVELVNRTQRKISLKGWTFSDATSAGTFPADSIAPGEHLLICTRTAVSAYTKFGRALALSAWPALNNAGELLRLKDEKGTTIDQVDFRDTWYGDAVKRAGGWTLERIDPDDHCSAGAKNWKASVDARGGTPGAVNSVKGSAGAPVFALLSAVLADSLTIRLAFSRALDTLAAKDVLNYEVNNGAGVPAVRLVPGDAQLVELRYATPLRRGLAYRITVKGVTDCAGNALKTVPETTVIYYPDRLQLADLLVSEILFNPRKGGADFLEIYNPTDRIFDLRDLSIAALDVKDSVVQAKPAAADTKLIFPGRYVAFSTDPANIRAEYRVKDTLTLLAVPGLPAWNDDAGSVVLVSGKSRIDQFRYSEKMHFPLIKIPEGVSLERSDFQRNANEKGNFRSAAALAGFATPGYTNSQTVEHAPENEEVSLSGRTFSPDNDGFEDELQVNFRFPEPGQVVNAAVYAEDGRLVHHLARNVTIGTLGALSWNGLDGVNQRLPVGVYSVVVEVFDLHGAVKRYKRNCALAAKL